MQYIRDLNHLVTPTSAVSTVYYKVVRAVGKIMIVNLVFSVVPNTDILYDTTYFTLDSSAAVNSGASVSSAYIASSSNAIQTERVIIILDGTSIRSQRNTYNRHIGTIDENYLFYFNSVAIIG